MKKGLDDDTDCMEKAIVFLKKHLPALCACVLAGIFALSAVWLRNSGIEKMTLGKNRNVQTVNGKNHLEKAENFCLPALGDVIVPYTAEELLFNPTTRVYEIHAGMDFLCPDGQAYCVMDGRVEDVFFDPLWGNTVVVLHENGDRSVYASLSETSVKKGKLLKAGDVIGKSGTTAAAEEKTGPHLHFEYRKNGKSQPISFTTAPET